MRWIAALLAVFWLSPAFAYEQRLEIGETPELRVVLGPEQALATNGYIGAQLVMRVQLISRYPFEALDLQIAPIPGTRTVELLRPRTRKVTSYAGEGYVFETAVAIIPGASGILTVPPVTAVGVIEPEKDLELRFDVASTPTDLKIAGIPTIYGDGWWLAAHRVEIDEQWSTPPDEIRAGDIVQRTVKVRAWGVMPDHLPELEHRQTQGTHIGLVSSRTGTERSPDGLIATAEYVWDIELNPQQVVFVAPLGVTYWDPVEHRQRRAGVPAQRIEPLPADSAAIAERVMREASESKARTHLVILVLAGVIAVPIAGFGIAYLMTALPSRSDLRLVQAARKAKGAADRYRLLTRWLAENRWQADEFDLRFRARKTLSDQLFAPRHPDVGAAAPVIRQALAYSRQRRRATLWKLVPGLLGSSRRELRL